MSLRELMVDHIKYYGWCDMVYTRCFYVDIEYKVDKYVEYLATLSDKDFLRTYNEVQRRSDSL